MGVPKFFRWLSERYPALLTRVNAYDIPDVDNFYLDMNGIIHSCSHPNDDDANAFISDAKIFEDVFAYIDALVRIIRPRRLLFLAIDGVAPRAKMNQQRSRRFRTALMAEQQEMEARQRGEWKELTAGGDDEKRFDSNTITPGTDFMCRLDEHLQYYIQRQVNEDPLWRQLKVIYSSHLTPGEGEHKIMDYIRYARSQNNYDVRTRHCLYGLDADLIMLGMASHEPYFTLLREEVKFGAPPRHVKGKDAKDKAPLKNKAEQITFFLLHLSLLRSYLEVEFQDLKIVLAERFNIEAIVDDWVFMNMLVGNDFIPHLPFMHINKGSLQKFYEAYRRAVPEMGGYINDHGQLHVDRFMIFIRHIAQAEQELMSEAREDDEWLMSKRRAGPIDSDDIWDDVAADDEQNDAEFMFVNENNDPAVAGGIAAPRTLLKRPEKLTAEELEQAEKREFDLFASDMRFNYYKKKFCLMEPSDDDVKTIAHELVRALVWNLGYYYCGVQSWEWYYPYHYSPYASDIWRVCSAEQFRDVEFSDRGRPFMPFEQLMAVLPARSKPCLPLKLQRLFNPDSPIYDFYPTDFLQDMDDKQNDWEAVVCVPFVDERRLVRAVADVLPQLPDEERRRNTVQPSYIYTYENTSGVSRALMSPNIRKLPNVGSCAVRVRNLSYDQMLLPKDDIKYGLLIDLASLQKYRKGYPQLNLVPFSAKVSAAGVKVFSHSSKSLSVVLKVKSAAYELGFKDNDHSDEADSDSFDFVNNNGRLKTKSNNTDGGQIENLQQRANAEVDIGCEHLGSDILVDWPYLYEARVDRVIDGLNGEQHVFDVNDGMIKQTAYNETPETFKRQMGAFGVQLKEKLAVDIGHTCVALGVRRKIGYQLYYDNNGRSAQFTPQYEKEMRIIPLQLCVPKSLWKLAVAEDNPINACGFVLSNNNNKSGTKTSSTTADGQLIDVKSIFKRNDLVFCTAAPFYGAVGQVLNVVEQQPSAQMRPGAWGQQFAGSSSPRLMVQVKFLWPYEADMIFVRQNYQDNLQPNYWGARELSQYLQMHPKLVSAFTGTLFIVHSKLPGANAKRQQKLLHGNNNDAEDDADEGDELDQASIAGMRSSSYNNQGGTADSSLKNVAKTNIGLNLKKNKTCKEVRGYSFKDIRTNQWLYSDRVADVLSRWRDKYPTAVNALSDNLGGDIRVDLLFADELDPMESLREMRKFINDLLPDAQRVEQASGCDYIDDAGIAELRRSKVANGAADTYCFTEMFRPQHLHKFMPGINDNAPPDSRPVYRIWDRVVNARPNCAVPIGIRGTVVRVEYEEAENNSNGGGDFDRRNNNNQSFQQQQQSPQQQNHSERRQRLIQVLWDESFKVNGEETDMYDLPPSYLMNVTYGRKLVSSAYNNVKMQRTSLTVHDLTCTSASSSKKHKLPDEAEGEDAKQAVRRRDGDNNVAAPSANTSTNHQSSDLTSLNRFLRKAPRSKINIDNSNNNNESSSIKSEALLELEAMIAATSNNNDGRNNEVDDERRARNSGSGEKPDEVAVGDSSEANNFLNLFKKKPLDDAQQPRPAAAVSVADGPTLGNKSNGSDPAVLHQTNLKTSPDNNFSQQQRVGDIFASPSKKTSSRAAQADSSAKKSTKKTTNENGEEWVNSFRDDYFDGDQQNWHAPPVSAGELEADDNKQQSGFRNGRGGSSSSSFRGRGGDSVRGSGRGGGRGFSMPDPLADDIYARAQRLAAQRGNGQSARGAGFAGRQQRAANAGGRMSSRNNNNVSPSTREIIIDADSMSVQIKGGDSFAEEAEWNEQWSRPLSNFVATRGPRSSRGRGIARGFVPRGSYSSRGGDDYRGSSRQQPRNQRTQQRFDEDADGDDEDFNNKGEWHQLIRPSGYSEQKRPFNDENRRPFAPQLPENSFADDSDIVEYNTEAFDNLTFHRKQQQYPSSPSANRNGGSRFNDFERDGRSQYPSSPLFSSNDGNRQRPPAMQRRRGEDSVPMPSNAAECVVYSVDDDYDYNEGFASVPPEHEAVYAPPDDDFNVTSPSAKESQPSASSTSNSGSGKAALTTLIQQMNKKGQQQQPAERNRGNSDDSAMSEALKQLEELAIDLPPPDDEDFPAETDEDADDNKANEQYQQNHQQQRSTSSSGDANNVAKMFSLARNGLGGINFVSGGYLRVEPNDKTAKTVSQPALPVPSYVRMPSTLPFPPSLRPSAMAAPEWRPSPPNVINTGVDPAVHSAGAGVLHYRQPTEQMRAHMSQHVRLQQLQQQYHYEAQARQQQHYAALVNHYNQQQQMPYAPRFVMHPHSMPMAVDAYSLAAGRPPVYVRPPPSHPYMFADARAQALAAGSNRYPNPMPFVTTSSFPAQQQPRNASSVAGSRPVISMIPRSALLRNSISRRPESNLSEENE